MIYYSVASSRWRSIDSLCEFAGYAQRYSIGWGDSSAQVNYRVAMNLYGDDRCGGDRV